MNGLESQCFFFASNFIDSQTQFADSCGAEFWRLFGSVCMCVRSGKKTVTFAFFLPDSMPKHSAIARDKNDPNKSRSSSKKCTIKRNSERKKNYIWENVHCEKRRDTIFWHRMHCIPHAHNRISFNGHIQ